MKKYNYEKGEVAWLSNSVVDGLPTVAVGIISIEENGLLTVYKTSETHLNKFDVLKDELISSETACKMADWKTERERKKGMI
jgi:hypothetical protein